MAGFQARLHALEGAHFRTEDQLATQRHLEKLVSNGKLPGTLPELTSSTGTQQPLSFASDALRSVRRRPASEVIYQHVQNGIPGTSRLLQQQLWALKGAPCLSAVLLSCLPSHSSGAAHGRKLESWHPSQPRSEQVRPFATWL